MFISQMYKIELLINMYVNNTAGPFEKSKYTLYIENKKF